jgi:hypothetical protein
MTKRLLIVLLTLAPSLLAADARAYASRQQESARPASIGFLYEDARLYVPVRIGTGAARWFILDTGVTGTIIDTAVARTAGLDISGGQTVHGAGSGSSSEAETSMVDLRVGSVALHVDQPAVMDLAHLLGPTSGRAPAGIIGSQFFREHFVDIDFATRKLAIFPPQGDRRSFYAATVPLTFADWTPLTHVSLELPTNRIVTANALVDLGAKSTFLVPEPYIAREKLRDAFPNPVVTGLGAGVGGDTFYAFARAKRLVLAGAPAMALANPVIGLSVGGTLRSTWHEGLLGADFLSRFRLGVDYTHHRLLLSRTGGAAEPFDRSGSFLGASGRDLKRIVVRQVLKGGPAQAAGLRPGDEIVSVNGVRADALGLPAVRERLKAPRAASVLVVYERGGERRRANIQLRDLL